MNGTVLDAGVKEKRSEPSSFAGLSGLEGGEWNAYENWRAENNISGIAFPMYDSEHNLIGEWVGAEDGKGGKIVTIAEVREAQEKGFPNANGSQFIDRGPHFETIEEAQAAALNGPIW